MTESRDTFMETGELDRRQLLRLLGRLAAVPACAEFFGAWLEAAPAPQHDGAFAPPEPPLLRNYTPAFFDAADFEALEAFGDILIPEDGTPGARAARCAHFIDFVLANSTEAAPDNQRRWRQAMTALREAGFHAAGADGRRGIVAAMAAPESDRGASHPAYFAYRLIKQQTAFAFFTSRAGTIEMLDYRGNRFNASFPACDHPEHRVL